MRQLAVFGAIFAGGMLAFFIVANAVQQASALTVTAADKVGIATSTPATTPLIQAVAGSNSSDVTLLTGTVKTANPIDLIISHS